MHEMIPEAIDGRMTGKMLHFDASGNAVDPVTESIVLGHDAVILDLEAPKSLPADARDSDVESVAFQVVPEAVDGHMTGKMLELQVNGDEIGFVRPVSVEPVVEVAPEPVVEVATDTPLSAEDRAAIPDNAPVLVPSDVPEVPITEPAAPEVAPSPIEG